MRCRAPDPLLRPCTDGFATTADGWSLGIRHIKPANPDPAKLPVVLCHGLGLNGTFWTITDNHLPSQLAAQGYHVFIPDMRGSGASQRIGAVGFVNRFLRQTPFLELKEHQWTVDHEAFFDVPAILDYVERTTGHRRVNWVGHSLGGMLLFAYLEKTPEPERIHAFVGMGSTIILADEPATRTWRKKMLRASRGIRGLLTVMATGRIARPMMFGRPPGLEKVDRFYYTAANVNKQTIDRFYGYTLENPGKGALQQLDPYLEYGVFLSADRRFDYTKHLDRVHTPILMVAGDGDIMSDNASTDLTFERIASEDKTLLRFGKAHGHIDDYGHCDLVWSRYAPIEIFPAVIKWLNERQPIPLPQQPAPAPAPSPQTPSSSLPTPREEFRVNLIRNPQSPPSHKESPAPLENGLSSNDTPRSE
jgi:pimeloyl-ACP methyl ester carboxylesterase